MSASTKKTVKILLFSGLVLALAVFLFFKFSARSNSSAAPADQDSSPTIKDAITYYLTGKKNLPVTPAAVPESMPVPPGTDDDDESPPNYGGDKPPQQL